MAGTVAHAADRRSHTADARSITAMQDVAALDTELAELREMVGMLAEMIVEVKMGAQVLPLPFEPARISGTHDLNVDQRLKRELSN